VPFVLLPFDHTDIQTIYDFYELSSTFPRDQFLVRTEKGQHRTLYFVSTLAKRLLEAANINSIRLVYCGAKMFVREDMKGDDHLPGRFRIQANGLPILQPFLGKKRVVEMCLHDVEAFLKWQNPKFDQLSEEVQKSLENMSPGCCICKFDASHLPDATIRQPVFMPIWRAAVSANLLLRKQDKQSLSTRLGITLV